ncbi:MAG: DUF1801 domain-containing protein [Armatimonadetes bacterium]|nr:DUF1801 domain-containing protein [Armatimonadota bacterium]
MDSLKPFVDKLDPDRAAAVLELRKTILSQLDDAVEERVSEAGIDYVIPHSVYPAGYHCNPKQPLSYAAVRAGKTGLTLHFLPMYMHEGEDVWVKSAFAEAGVKLDMGMGCLRFKKPGEIPYAIIAQLLGRTPGRAFLDRYSKFMDTRNKK